MATRAKNQKVSQVSKPRYLIEIYCVKAMIKGLLLIAGLLLGSSVWAKTACPSQNFHVFIKAFANSQVTQQAFSTIPLKNTYRDGRVEGNPFKTEYLGTTEIQYPVMLSEYRAKQWTLPTTIKRKNRYNYTVRVTADNSTTTLEFKKYKSCWRLASIYNPAL